MKGLGERKGGQDRRERESGREKGRAGIGKAQERGRDGNG